MFSRHVATSISIFVLVLTLGVLGARPAAAVSGFDAAYCGQGAYVTAHAGDTVQSSVCFMNTGTTAWVAGSASEVALAVCVDLPFAPFFACDTLSPYGDWASGWTTTRIYGSQSTSVVSPGSSTNFLWNVKVPAAPVGGTSASDYVFRGELILRSTGQVIHPIGYFQVIHVI